MKTSIKSDIRDSRIPYILSPTALPYGPKGFPVYDPWDLYHFFHSIASEGYIYYSEWGKIHLVRSNSVQLNLPVHGPWTRDRIPPFSFSPVVQSSVSICAEFQPSAAHFIKSISYSRYLTYKQQVAFDNGVDPQSVFVASNEPFLRFFHPSVPLKYMCKNCLKVAPHMGSIERTLF